MLRLEGFDPGVRPAVCESTTGRLLFKETALARSQRAPNSRSRPRSDELRPDSWHNSGGVRGSRDMHIETRAHGKGALVVRRRYGSVVRQKEIIFRFHEYSLIHGVADGVQDMRWVEDRATTIFHVMPKRNGRGRPSREEADEPLGLWREHQHGRALLMCAGL